MRVGDKVKIIGVSDSRLDTSIKKKLVLNNIGKTFKIIAVDVHDDIYPVCIELDDKNELWLRYKEFEIIEKQSGLTNKEEEIMEYIIDAWNLFIELENTHPNEKVAFANGIHQLQNILGMRVLRRDYPKVWGKKED